MDQRLHKAACNGDVEELLKLLKEGPLTLFIDSLAPISNNPLHIAALLGHTDFAKLVMTQNPELSTEMNHHGYSPIHLASSKGYLPIVMDLLNFVDDGRSLCILKALEGRIALHCAAIKGRVDVIRQLVSYCPESAKEVTSRGETILHLIVKNNHYEVMVSLLPLLRALNLLDEIINYVDEHGNTVLHVAAATKQYQMVKMLLGETEVNVNTVNARGFTALDVSKMCSSEFDNMDIGEMIRHAQVQRPPAPDSEIASFRNQEQVVVIDSNVDDHTNSNMRLSNIESMNSDDEPEIESVKNGLIVLCSMFTTFCFEAILNPPGGLWQDQQSSSVFNTSEAHKVHKHLTNNIFLRFANYLSILVQYFLKINVITSFDYLISMMLIVMIVSAAMLYNSVLALVTNGQFAAWAMRVGITHFLMVGIVYNIIMFCERHQIWEKIKKVFPKIINKTIRLFWALIKIVWKMIRKVC